jgi:hypothetical protein
MGLERGGKNIRICHRLRCKKQHVGKEEELQWPDIWNPLTFNISLGKKTGTKE